MQNKASMNESKYSEQFYAQGEDGKDYQIEIELEDGPSAEDPEKLTVVLNGERKTVDVPKGGTDDHYKKAIAAGLKELGKYKLMEGKIPDANEGKYPEFVKIESEDDYKNYVVPTLGDILKKGYEFNDIKGLWLELGEDSENAVPKGRRKTMRQILRLEGPGARFLESYSDRINNPLASEYVQGMDAEWYGVKEDDLYEGKAPDVNEGKYPRFVQIKTRDDYNKYFVPTFGGDLLKKGYKFSELENAWWEIAPEEEGQIQPKARLKSMRQIVNNDFEPKFIYVENDILDLESAGSYISAMGVEPSDYGVREDDLYENKANEATKKPLYVYIGYSGSWGDGDDEKTKLPAGDNYLDIVSKHFDTKPEEIDAKWRKKLENCKTDADFGKVLAAMYDAMEAFVFALRRGNECVWANPKGSAELDDKDWQGPDYDWLTANV